MKRIALSVLLLFAVSSAGVIGCDQSAEDATADEPEAEEQTEEQTDGADDETEGALAEESAETDDGEEESAEASGEAVVGEEAPDFTLEDVSGEEHILSDYRGEVVVLEWFNFDCPYVERHYDEGTFDSVLEEAGGTEEVTWLAIDTTSDHDAEDIRQWKEESSDLREHDYPYLVDTDGAVGRMYDAQTTPHMYVIDEEGVLRYKGGIDDDPRGREEERTNYVENALTAMQAGESIETTEAEPYGCSVKYPEGS